MNHDETTDRLEMRWVPVTGADGRTRMEAVWIHIAPATLAHAAA